MPTPTPASIELSEKIAAAMQSTKGSRARAKALSEIKWQLVANDGTVAGLNERGQCLLVSTDSPFAQTFDGRDDEVMKVMIYGATLGTTLAIKLLP